MRKIMEGSLSTLKDMLRPWNACLSFLGKNRKTGENRDAYH
jgi:hypothetical protein